MAVVSSSGVSVTGVESLICDLGSISEWCDLWGMKFNASKAKTMIVSTSRTMHPLSPPLTIDGTVLKESDDLVILGVTFDFTLAFEKHLRLVSRAASQRLGLLRKFWRAFHDRSLLERCFWGFVSCPFWSIVLQSCTGLPIHTFNYWTVQSVVPGSFHHRSVGVLCMLYKIRCNPMHPLNDALPGPYVPVRVTCGALVAHRYTYAPPRCRTSQYRRTFNPFSVSLWNDLANPVFDGVGLEFFKSRANDSLLA